MNGSNDYQAEFTCHPDFRLNTKTKNPPNTKFNVSIKDVLFVTGVDLGDCEMFLRLDNGTTHGQPVCSCFFKPLTPYIDSSTNNREKKKRLYQAKIDIPPSLNTKKGNSSSRVGFIEIYDSNNKLVAVSDKFWIRSRSRDQMLKDETTKKRARSNQQAFRKSTTAIHNQSPSNTTPTFTSSSNTSSTEPSLKKMKQTPTISRNSLMSPHLSSPQPPQNVVSPNSASHSRTSNFAFGSPQRFSTSLHSQNVASSFDNTMGSPCGRTQASSSLESPQLVLPSSSNLKPESSHTLPPLRDIFSPQMVANASSSNMVEYSNISATTMKQGGGEDQPRAAQQPIRSVHHMQQSPSGFAAKPQQYSQNATLLYSNNNQMQDSSSENLLRTLEDSLHQQQDQIQELMRLISNNAQAINRMQEKLHEIMLSLSSVPNNNP